MKYLTVSTIGLILICLLLVCGAFAQNKKAISADEFNRIEVAAKSFLSNNPFSYVEVSEWKNRKTSKITSKTETTVKVIPPSRSYRRTQSTENGKLSIFEEIVIGSTKYRSNGDGQWAASGAVTTSPLFSMTPDASGESYYFVGDEMVNDIKARVFLKERKSTYRFEGSTKDQVETYTKRIWVGPAGEYRKTTSSLNNGPESDNETITQYTFPKELIIVAPMK